MNQYLPWLLIGAGILVVAVLIYWRMSYIESD
jgi:sensor domain CHASE-containing protein